MATERLNVFKLATDKLVYVTKIREEIVVVIANTSEQTHRAHTKQVSCVIFQIYTKHV